MASNGQGNYEINENMEVMRKNLQFRLVTGASESIHTPHAVDNLTRKTLKKINNLNSDLGVEGSSVRRIMTPNDSSKITRSIPLLTTRATINIGPIK